LTILIIGYCAEPASAHDDKILSVSEAERAGRQADREKRSDLDLRVLFEVGATRVEKKGEFAGWVVLNSDDTFGSCHDLQIAISPQIWKDLEAAGLSDKPANLQGKRLLLRARVACVDEPRKDGKGTYRQVRLNLLSSSDLKVLAEQ
jgi:hypothetical protein